MATVGNHAYVLRWRVSVALARFAGAKLPLAHSVRHLGDAYSYAGELSLAEPCYVEALAIYRQSHGTGTLDLANATRSYAVLKSRVGATDAAKRLWQDAHDLYAAIPASAGVAESAARLALLAWRAADLPRSRDWITEANAAASVANDAETLTYVGEVMNQIATEPEA